MSLSPENRERLEGVEQRIEGIWRRSGYAEAHRALEDVRVVLASDEVETQAAARAQLATPRPGRGWGS